MKLNGQVSKYPLSTQHFTCKHCNIFSIQNTAGIDHHAGEACTSNWQVLKNLKNGGNAFLLWNSESLPCGEINSAAFMNDLGGSSAV